MKSYKLVIFDWDGTVMDSVPKIVNCMHQSALACGVAPPSDEAIKKYYWVVIRVCGGNVVY